MLVLVLLFAQSTVDGYADTKIVFRLPVITDHAQLILASKGTHAAARTRKTCAR